ncbi:MAG: NAD(P)-binding domain-containing protein, partial [Actinomycetia bacterium]|nr:NAD(P)-binding domain-containing protein [Actinomycetes bacterium]
MGGDGASAAEASPARVAVFGAGSWGTTFAKVARDAGSEVTLWGRRPELVARVNQARENPDYLPGVRLPAGIRATCDPVVALEGAQLVALAIPAQSLRANLTRWAAQLPGDATLISLMKGVELGTAKLMSQVIAEVADAPAERIAVVSGPNLALEV